MDKEKSLFVIDMVMRKCEEIIFILIEFSSEFMDWSFLLVKFGEVDLTVFFNLFLYYLYNNFLIFFE